MKKPQRSGVKVKKKKFHPLRLQISVWFIGLLLLSMVITTVINGLFLEHYYISKKTEVLQEAVENLEDLKLHRMEAAVQKFQMQCLRTVQRIT